MPDPPERPTANSRFTIPRRPATAMTALAVVTFVLVATYVLAIRVGIGRRLDSQVAIGFDDLDRPRFHGAARAVTSIGDPRQFVVIGVLMIAVALLRSRPRTALAITTVLIGANVTTQLGKILLSDHRFTDGLRRQVGDGSFPSGHATASMSLALCAILVAAPRWRPLTAAIGAAVAIAVSFSLLALGWHYPSDVLGGYVVAAAWSFAAVGGLWAAALRWPEHTGRAAARRMRDQLAPPTGRLWPALAPTALGIVAAVTVCGLALLARPDTVIGYARDHTLFVAGAFTIAALGVSLAAGLAAALRR